ncbi:MAG: lipopolysaccharide biosynthesis protein [Flammeovirgaceae bacterium]
MKKRDFKKPLMALCDQALVSGYNFTLAICLTTWLGIKQYGVFALMWMVVLFCSSIHQQLIIAPMQAFGGNRDKQKKQAFYGQLLYQQLAFSALAGLGVWLFIQLGGHWFSIAMDKLNWLLPAVAFLFLMCDYFRKRFIVLQETTKAFFFDLIICSSQFALIYYRVIAQGHTDLDVILRAITQGLSVGVFIGVYAHEYLIWNIPAFQAQVKKHLQHSKWLLGTALTQWFAGNWFVVTAGILLGPATIGAIRIAQNILGLFHIPFLAIENYLPTQLMKLYQQKSLLSFKHQFIKLLLVGGLIMSAGLAGLSLISKEIIQLVYGNAFIEYNFVVQGFCLLYAFVFIGILLRIYLRTIEQTSFIFWGYILNMLFTFCLANYFTMTWGIYGTLSGLIASQLILLAVMLIPLIWYSHKKAMQLNPILLITKD